MEFTQETAIQFVKDTLVKNGFTEVSDGVLIKGKDLVIKIQENHYIVSNYDTNFIEWMDWFSPDLNIYSLLGYLSFHDFITRGYEK